jgi:hypothetical protein
MNKVYTVLIFVFTRRAENFEQYRRGPAIEKGILIHDMSLSNRKAFYTWYEQQKDKVFDFQTTG